MPSSHRRRLPALLVCAATLVGCGWTNRAEVANYREANRQLAAQARLQLAEIENLKAHTRQVEDQLIAAEEALVQLQRPVRADRGSEAVVTTEAPLLWKAAAQVPATAEVRR